MLASASTFRFYQMGRSQACIMKTDTVSFFVVIQCLYPCKSGKQLVIASLCPNVNFKFKQFHVKKDENTKTSVT